MAEVYLGKIPGARSAGSQFSVGLAQRVVSEQMQFQGALGCFVAGFGV